MNIRGKMNIDLNQYFEKQKKFSGNVLLARNNKIIWVCR